MRICAFLIGGLVLRGFAVAQVPAAFEVASIKSVALDAKYLPREIAPRMDSPLRFHARAQAERLIEWAFQVRDFQITGGPAWMRDGSVRYEIQATAPGPSSETDMRRMMQTLLTERFGLKWHAEKREMPVYILAPGKNGTKIVAVKTEPRDGGDGDMNIGNGRFFAHNVTMKLLTQILTENMDRPVLDRTGFAERFDFDLHYDPALLIDWRLAPVLPSMMGDLGLRLEPEKAVVDFMAIDAIQRPTDN